MEKLLRINMSAEGGPAAGVTPVGEYAGLGGRALTSAVVSKEVPPLAHPLGEDNKLVIAPGMLSGPDKKPWRKAGSQGGQEKPGEKK
jgi:aldehyde:ferredoxin oxidoreductase